MKVLNLCCAHDHRFEGWFGSDDDYQSQFERGLVECPICGDKAIAKLPTAPRLNVSGSRAEPPQAQVPARQGSQGNPASQNGPGNQAAAFMQVMRHVMENTEDVGDRFAEEARRIHYGEAEERGIRGQATKEDTESLREEGIDVVTVKLPPSLKGPLQ